MFCDTKKKDQVDIKRSKLFIGSVYFKNLLSILNKRSVYFIIKY